MFAFASYVRNGYALSDDFAVCYFLYVGKIFSNL